MPKDLELRESSKKKKKKKKKIKFKGVLCRDSHSQNIGDILVFMSNSTLREKINSFFREIFTSTDKIFFSGGGLSTRQ